MMNTVEFKITGMSCEGCVKSIERVLAHVEGVTGYRVLLAEGKAVIDYDPGKVAVARLKSAIGEMGYGVAD
ncbi:MAG: heavy-metal-associated domain-containing protein [Proteobacteria bacterium]|nr:heavy-metal-associated domain-containing protein [Pseudomonadota bacterium]